MILRMFVRSIAVVGGAARPAPAAGARSALKRYGFACAACGRGSLCWSVGLRAPLPRQGLALLSSAAVSPARRAAGARSALTHYGFACAACGRGSRRPCTCAKGYHPLEPRFDAFSCKLSCAYASRNPTQCARQQLQLQKQRHDTMPFFIHLRSLRGGLGAPLRLPAGVQGAEPPCNNSSSILCRGFRGVLRTGYPLGARVRATHGSPQHL